MKCIVVHDDDGDDDVVVTAPWLGKWNAPFPNQLSVALLDHGLLIFLSTCSFCCGLICTLSPPTFRETYEKRYGHR